MPLIGPNKGEINIAPITTAVLFIFNPTEQTKVEHIKIQRLVPLKLTPSEI